MEPVTSLTPDQVAYLLARAPTPAPCSPASSTIHGAPQPVHTVYGGGHLFKSTTPSKLGSIASRVFQQYARVPDDLAGALAIGDNPALVEQVHARVARKLAMEPVEDYRIDFEDGYGHRPDDEEDGHAANCAAEVARGLDEGALPAIVGFRVKAFVPETRGRALRTLDVFLTALAEGSGGRLPDNFVIALPKVSDVESVSSFVDAVSMLEERCGFGVGTIAVEIMVETPEAIVAPDGSCHLPRLVEAAGGRCVAAHFGAYDYTAALGITAAHQSLDHPACDLARNMMQVALAGTGVRMVDGATTRLPIEPHRPAPGETLSREQHEENRISVHDAWRMSARNIARAMACGFCQGWDLHPAQLPIRFAATYAFFLDALDDATRRLGRFIEKAAQATRVGSTFDDAATGQGLLNFFLRGMDCGAITEDALTGIGLSADAVRRRSFMEIVRDRQDEKAASPEA